MTDDLFSQIAARVDSESQQTAYLGVQHNPDELASASKLAKGAGVPVDVAMDPKLRPGLEQQQKLETVNQRLQDLSPVARKWFNEDPMRLGMAHDDLGSLTSIDTAFQKSQESYRKRIYGLTPYQRAKRMEEDKVERANRERDLEGASGVATSLTAKVVHSLDTLMAAPNDVQEAVLNATVGRVFGAGAVQKVRTGARYIDPTQAWIQWLGKKGHEWGDAASKSERESENILITDPDTKQTFWNADAVKPWKASGLENIAGMVASEAAPMAVQIGATMATGGAAAPSLAPTGGRLLKLSSAILRYAKSPAGMIEVGRTVQGQYESGIRDVMDRNPGMTEDEAKIKVAPGALLAGVFSSAAGAPMEGKIIEDLLEKVAQAPGGKTLVRRIAGRLSSTVTTAGKEGTQEIMNGIGEDLAAWITYNPDKTLKEAAANAVMNFVGGAAMGGASGFAMHGAHVQENRKVLDTVGQAATDSRLLQRSPEVFAEAVAALAENGEIGIPAEQFTTYFQSKGIDPVQMAAELKVKNLQEAMEAGTDVMLPVAEIAKLPEHFEALKEDIRLHPEDPTEREYREMEAAYQQEQDRLEAEAKDETQAQADEDLAFIQDDLTQKLVAIGTEKSTAEAYAAGEVAKWRTLAERTGISPRETYERYGFTFSNVAGEVSKKSTLEMVKDRLKSGGLLAAQMWQSAKKVMGFGDEAPKKQPLVFNTVEEIPTGTHFKRLDRSTQEKVTTQIEGEIQAWVNDPESFFGAYDANKETRGGRLVNGDIIYSMLPTVQRNLLLGHTAGETVDYAILSHLTTLRNELVSRAIDKAGGLPVAITAGGQSSGKTTAANWILEGGNAGAVIDAPHDNAPSVEAIVRKVLAAGKDASIVFVERPNFGASEISNIIRADKEGRYVPSRWRADTTTKVPGEMLKLGEIFRNQPRVALWHLKNLETHWEDVGGRLHEGGKDAMASIRGMSIPATDDLVNQAFEAYLEFRKGEQDGTRDAINDHLRTKIEAGYPGRLDAFSRGQGQTDGANQTPERGSVESVPESPLVQGLRSIGIDPDKVKNAADLKALLDKAEANPSTRDAAREIRNALRGETLFQRGGGRFANAAEKRAWRAKKAGQMTQASMDKAMTDAHETEEAEFAKFEEEVLKVQAGDIHSGDQRGFIQIGANQKIHIGMLENRDLSTVLHELGHAWLEITADIAERPETPQAFKDGVTSLTQEFSKNAKVAYRRLESAASVARAEVEAAKGEGKKPRAEDLEMIEAHAYVQAHGGADFMREVGEARGRNLPENLRGAAFMPYHELFAEWNEAYLLEGKAPSQELRGIFQRFKAWMKLVYGSLTGFGVKLSPEVRDFFDRIYASDREIEAAKGEVNTVPLFAKPEDAGMTEAQFGRYTKAVQQQIESAREALDSQLLREAKREKEQWWKEEKARIKGEVEREISAQPEYMTLDILKDPSSEVRLSAAEVERQFGKDALKRLPRNATVAEGGMDAETAAMALGYESGADLVEALSGLEPKDKVINREVADRMREAHGDLRLDGTIADAAKEALHNEARETALLLELRAIRGLQNKVAPIVREAAGEERAKGKAAVQAEQEKTKALKDEAKDQKRQAKASLAAVPKIETFRNAARAVVESTKVMDLKPYRYLLADRKHARLAAEAMAKGDHAAAADAKSKQILNHCLFIEATKALDEVAKIRAKAKKGMGGTIQAMLGKAGKDYQEAYNALLARFSFDKVSNKAIQEGNAAALLFDALHRSHEDAGIDIDPVLLAITPKNFKEATLSELRALKDALANLEHVARESNRVLVGKQKEDLDEAVAGLISTALKHNETKPVKPSGSTFTAREKAARMIQGLGAHLKQMVRILDQLDGGDADGWWHRAIWQPISDAMGREADLGAAVNKRLQEVIEKRGDFTKKYLDTSIGITLPGEAVPMNRRQAITFLLNLGTEENRNAMLGGYKLIQADGSLNPMVDEILSTLTKEELTFAQDIWNVLESMWPAVEDLEMRIKGIAPKRKTETGFTVTTRDGETVYLKGGYFPQVGEPLDKTGKRQESGDLSQIFEQGYTRATTNKSHTKRVTGATYRVNLDFAQVLSRHLPSVIKDITHREAVLSINRILSQPEVSRVVQETMGPKYEEEFLPWLKATVNNRNAGPQDPIFGALMGLRHRMVIAQLGFNLSSLVVQITDAAKVTTEVPAKHLARAYADLMRSPKETVAMIRELSPNRMAHFEENYHRDLMQWFEAQDILERKKNRITEIGMSGFRMMGQLSAFPAWLGAYQQGMAEHGDSDKAVREADTVVDRVIQMGNPANLSALMRDKGAKNLFTTFQGDLNIWFNIISSAVGEKNGKKLAKGLLAFYLSGIIGNLLVGRGPKDDEEWYEWAVLKGLIGWFELVPLLGDFAKVGLAKVQGKPVFNQQFSPVFTAAMKPLEALGDVSDAATDDGGWDDAAFSSLDAAGTFAGLPGTAQTLKTTKYLNRLAEGDERPDHAGDVAMGVLFGKRK